MVIYIPALVMIIGLLAYALSASPKASEVGRLAFFAGLLVTLWMLAAGQVRIH